MTTTQDNGTPCKGQDFNPQKPMNYHPIQEAWMLLNKPLYYTGDLKLDIAHLPLELRSL